MVAREQAAAEVPGEFVSSQLQADCARFLQEAQKLAARRRQRASAHVQRPRATGVAQQTRSPTLERDA
jgi:hypothetical protein